MDKPLNLIIIEIIQAVSCLNFLVLGDWGHRNSNQQKVAKAISNFILRNENNNDSTFIISTGDNFYSYGVKSIHDEKWKYIFEDAFNQKGFKNKKWYITVGNHDYAGYGWKGIQAQIDYTKISNRWNFPNNYYSK